MPIFFCYIVTLYTIYSFLSISLPWMGLLWLIIAFALIFLGVHGAKIFLLGLTIFKRNKNAPSPSPETKEKTPPKSTDGAEPVYYIVEKKKRTKSSYSLPKEIKFK